MEPSSLTRPSDIAPAQCAGCAVRSACAVGQLLAARHGRGSAACRRKMQQRGVIFEEGTACEDLHVVTAGIAALYKNAPDGASHLLQFAFPGDILDWRAISPQSRHAVTAIGQPGTEICVTQAATVRKAIAAGGAGALAFAKQTAAQLESEREDQVWRSSATSRQRLLYALWQLTHHQARRQPDGTWSFELPVTRRDLASLIYTRPETISRMLKMLEDDDLAYFDGRRVVIPDVAALQQGKVSESAEIAVPSRCAAPAR